MKAILLAGVTSIHNFPVRTTGPDCQKHVPNRWIQDFLHSCRHFYTRYQRHNKREKYLRLALVSVDNGYSAQELASLLDRLTLYFCPTWLRKIGFECDNLTWTTIISGERVTVRIISSNFNIRTQTLSQDRIPSPSQRSAEDSISALIIIIQSLEIVWTDTRRDEVNCIDYDMRIKSPFFDLQAFWTVSSRYLFVDLY